MSRVAFAEAVQHLLVPIDTIELWPLNPRSGDLTALKQSITTNGFYQPIVVQRSTSYVIAGNHRVRALREMGEAEVPVVYVDIDDTEAKRIALADNRTSDLAFYDDQALFDLLDDLYKGEGLEGTGYDRAAYELLLQGLETDGHVVGGVRQGVSPEERIDAYNELDIRSLILPYSSAQYEVVAKGFVTLRDLWDLESNAEVVYRLVTEALSEADAA